MKWIAVAVRRPVTVMMGAVTLLMFGLISLGGLSVNLLPDLSYPTLTVRTELQGAAPAEIETLLTRPIEESVGTVNNVRSIDSISRTGQSDVILEFAWGTNMDMAGLDVREKLEVLQLPLDAGRPSLLRFNPATDPIVRMGLGFKETPEIETRALKALRRHADEELKKAIEPVAGVAAVKISGGLEDQIQIEIDPERMARMNIDVAELAARLAAENVNVSAGRLETGNQRYLVRTMNQFTSVEEIAGMIVAERGSRPVYLRDLADVSQGFSERKAVIRLNGREAVELAVYKEGDTNTVGVAEAVIARLESVRAELPDGMQLVVVENQATFIGQAIDEVIGNALLGGVLAMLVIFAFLRDWASTLIVAVSIPISIVATFFLMAKTGISLNIMSLGGIALATGLLVDNAIVVLENISRQRSSAEAGDESRVGAAIRGGSEVAGAVLASTLTTIAVFFPLAFVEGIAGQLFSDQALTVTYALAISLLVAMTLIPMLAARLGGRTGKRAETGEFAGGRLMQALRGRYQFILERALRHRLVVLVVAAALLGGSLAFLVQQDTELVPQLAQGRFEVTAELPPGTPLAETDRVMRRIQSAAEPIAEVGYVFGVAGSGNRIDANPTETGENISRILVALNNVSPEAEQRAMAGLRAAASKQPGLKTRISRPELMSFDKPIEIQIAGYELDALKSVAAQVTARLKDSDRLVDLESSMDRGHPEVQVHFDQERIAALGLSVRQVADQLVNTVRGTVATRYSWRDRKIDILVRAGEPDRSSIDDIRNLIVNPDSARPVTLEAVAEVTVAEGPAEIRRANQERVAVISANLAFGALSAAVEDVNARLSGLPVPPTMRLSVLGQNAEMQASIRSLLFALGLAIFLVYIVMASQFESLLHPFVILFSVPLAAVGVALALAITGTTISVMVFIGMIMLSGIVVNNAIVLVDLINRLRSEGVERTRAIMQAGSQRLRPILMTTLTTALGLLPMAIGLGEGAEIRMPMAITVIGGLLVSMVLTLIVVPVVYTLLDRSGVAIAVEPGGIEASAAV
ncbi:MAG TPA: efflux RND transporter permease subunit [Wenzhouxiangellaceae bacterium]|nr:efflux RND transporter permease subunit [Wenzhouxiangellaceae bacterium]